MDRLCIPTTTDYHLVNHEVAVALCPRIHTSYSFVFLTGSLSGRSASIFWCVCYDYTFINVDEYLAGFCSARDFDCKSMSVAISTFGSPASVMIIYCGDQHTSTGHPGNTWAAELCKTSVQKWVGNVVVLKVDTQTGSLLPCVQADYLQAESSARCVVANDLL
ncbi:hypothetical protein B0H17DRAFT_1208051 [Mycena rosella]|uniref:Uncharacterized protein n=1 Tax=Mycena rosella TaxID=1033263 RepID=A0AAD7GBQ5_MYCRO|nr:hypothetical protein B0H17DRAFT_1208051 [Mycena rosella]